ncbi:hypothetical protein [Nocardiopsis sp. NPDC006938]|uniref:hypothetical protein n=1 Tax=Nocardiopsis sp. NPDC006938 TaxID=3364337 RepID=UPI00369194AD
MLSHPSPSRDPYPGRPRRITAVVASWLVLVLVSGCTGPTPTESLYRDAAEQTVTALLSAVGTGIMLSEIHRRDMAFSPYTETTVEDAEDAARSVNDTFGTRQPPTPRARSLRSELAPLCDSAVNALSDLRIALREDDGAAVRTAERSLRSVAVDLTELQDELS